MTTTRKPAPLADPIPAPKRAPRDPEAYSRLYTQLLELARAKWRREPSGHTLQATAVANEVFLRLGDFDPAELPDDFALRRYLAGAIRNYLCEYAKRRKAERRGGGWTRTEIDDVIEVVEERVGGEVSYMGEMLTALGRSHPAEAEVVQMRFFVGLSHEEIGAAMERTPRQVERLWLHGKEWLRERLGADRPSP